MILGSNGGLLRRTIGFRSEVVQDSEEHETFAVTGGHYLAPDPGTMERESEDATCHSRRDAARKPSPKTSRS